MKVGIVDYGMGNIKSLVNGLLFLGYEIEHLKEHRDFEDVEVIILPGVGAFPNAMKKLEEMNLISKLNEIALMEDKKIIGICLGMQLLFSKSFEFGETNGLGIIEGEVIPFELDSNYKIPHMGWNNILSTSTDFNDFENDYYFVHSFYCLPKNDNEVLFNTNYGIDFCAGVKKGNNVFGMQFHPEKSQHNGLRLLDKIIKY